MKRNNENHDAHYDIIASIILQRFRLIFCAILDLISLAMQISEIVNCLSALHCIDWHHSKHRKVLICVDVDSSIFVSVYKLA